MTVFRYSFGSSSSSRRDRNNATTCSTTAMTIVPAAIIDRNVHSPGVSKPQNRKRAREKPRRTVIAVMIPCRYLQGSCGRCCRSGGGNGRRLGSSSMPPRLPFSIGVPFLRQLARQTRTPDEPSRASALSLQIQSPYWRHCSFPFRR